MLEVVRFGARRAANNIGCCAIDLVQGFNCDPASPAKVKLLHGDSGTVLMKDRKVAHAGPTNLDVLDTYLRIGTFGLQDSPDRVFLCALSVNQVNGAQGKKWLAILKERGFEFIRTTNNTVYNGGTGTPHPVYLFGLFRNISGAKVADPFAPPKSWTELPEPTMTAKEWWDSTKTTLILEDVAPVNTPLMAASMPLPIAAG